MRGIKIKEISSRELPFLLKADQAESLGDIIDISLETVRDHFGMEIAYLSEFVDGRSIFRAVSAPGFEAIAYPGVSMDINEVYCQHILNGSLPKLMTDTYNYALAMDMPITRSLPIRSHVSVPIYYDDGSIYGMFCCLSRQPNPTLTGRDLKVMESFAGIASKHLNEKLRSRAVHVGARARLADAMNRDQITIALQPIFDLATEELLGFEALSRFTGLPYRTPDLWFQEARTVGLQLKLEIYAIRKAIAMLTVVPNGLTLSINASPDTIAAGGFRWLESITGIDRVIIEVTEHAIVNCYDLLFKELSHLRSLGVKVAVDDVGAGYSGLIHLLRMFPDVLKLDIELVRDIDTNAAKQSLVFGMVHFANSIGAVVIAEGIETEAERTTLRSFGVQRGQGYLLGKPGGQAETQKRIADRFTAGCEI